MRECWIRAARRTAVTQRVGGSLHSFQRGRTSAYCLLSVVLRVKQQCVGGSLPGPQGRFQRGDFREEKDRCVTTAVDWWLATLEETKRVTELRRNAAVSHCVDCSLHHTCLIAGT